eukprot:TRINITY_DN2696_c0_g1_i1.p1 TRINITY_DN2696_c0_g1~~TRINITY_DN2696_c0_g1_i1.p1  ORF type:complete len:180 (+),score=29.04 TRINITY_DN2696_c0_g1_i1:113-652(+)
MNFFYTLFIISFAHLLSFGLGADISADELLGNSTWRVVPSADSGIKGAGYQGANVTFHSNGAGSFMGLSLNNIFENFTFIWEPDSENSSSIRIFGTPGCTSKVGIYNLEADDTCNAFVFAGKSDPCTPRWAPLNNAQANRTTTPITCPEPDSDSGDNSGVSSLTVSSLLLVISVLFLTL